MALLSSPVFDATHVDPASVKLGGVPVKQTGKAGKWACQTEDVDGDPLLDLVCHVVSSQLTISAGDTMIVLEGETFGGIQVRGEDSIQVVPN